MTLEIILFLLTDHVPLRVIRDRITYLCKIDFRRSIKKKRKPFPFFV